MAPSFRAAVEYPHSDGEPMADNTLQWDTIAYLVEALRHWYTKRNDVFVAGDLLWYYEEGNPRARIAPDCLVAFGRPPGYRGSYQQWVEDKVCPHVVFEVLSPANTRSEMELKYALYDRFGCQEYYLIDPYDRLVSGFHRVEGALIHVANAIGHRSTLLALVLGFRENFFDFKTDAGHSLLRSDEARSENEFLRAKLRAVGIDPDA